MDFKKRSNWTVRLLYLALIATAVLASYGCVVRPADTSSGTQPGLHALHLSPSLVSSDGEPIAFDDSRVAPQTRRVYEFRYRAGTFGVVGNPEFLTFQAVLVQPEGFQVDVDAWKRQLRGRLAPMTKSVTDRGFVISPEDTRLGQIYPRVLRPSKSRINIPPRLGRLDRLVTHDGTQIVLAAFDRPCRIQGVWDSGNGRLHADVQVPAPGLYPLMIVEGEDGNAHIRLGSASSLALKMETVLYVEGGSG